MQEPYFRRENLYKCVNATDSDTDQDGYIIISTNVSRQRQNRPVRVLRRLSYLRNKLFSSSDSDHNEESVSTTDAFRGQEDNPERFHGSGPTVGIASSDDNNEAYMASMESTSQKGFCSSQQRNISALRGFSHEQVIVLTCEQACLFFKTCN